MRLLADTIKSLLIDFLRIRITPISADGRSAVHRILSGELAQQGFNVSDRISPPRIGIALVVAMTLLIPATTQATTGPIGHWKLDKTSGTTVPDSAGSITGSFQGNPVWVTDDVRGRAVELDGSGDAVRLVNGSALNPQLITVMAWIKTPASSTNATQIFSKDDSIAPRERVWQFRVAGSNRLNFIVFDTLGTPVTATGVKDLGDNQWHHVTGTWDGTTIKVYVDGVLDGSVAHSGSLQTGQTNDAFIGRSGTSSPGYFEGRIDDVRLYDRALSIQEIFDAMIEYEPAAQGVDPCAGVVSYWPLEQAAAANEIIDACATNDGDFEGSPAWVNDAERGTVLSFNGTNNAVRISNHASLNPSLLTISAWIKTTAPGSSADHVLTKDDSIVPRHRVWQFRISGSNRLQLIVFNTFGAVATATGTTNLGDNQWHHVAGTWDGATVRVYVDGVLDGSKAFFGTLQSGQTNRAFLGRSETSSPGYFDGLIDDVRFYDHALTAVEIATLFQPPVSPTWQDFVDSSTSGAEPILPDFSYSGYQHSEMPIPDVAGPVFNVTSYGAVAGDGQSDRNAIQAAVDAAEAAGGGVVFFPAGVFHLNTSAGPEDTISIEASNVILRGAGSEGAPTGTTLTMPHYNELSDPKKAYSTPFTIRFRVPGNPSTATLAQITADADRETFTVTVNSTANLSIGQWVTLSYNSCVGSESDCHEDPGFEHYLSPYVADFANWYRAIQFKERHQIAAISGNQVTFMDPLHVEIDLSVLETGEAWTVHEYPHLEEVGIEDLFFEGGLTQPFVHHVIFEDANGRAISHDSAWSGVFFDSAIQCWARRLRFRNWSQALQFFGSSSCSVFDVTFLGNPGHHSIHSRGGTGNLIGLSRDLAGSYHGPSVGYGSASTVFWRYWYPGNSSFDAHSTSPYATLLDLTSGGVRYGRAGGEPKGMPNHLRHFVLWNFEHRGPGTAFFDFWNPSPRTYFVKPILVGFHTGEDSFGPVPSFAATSVDIDESHGAVTAPESLFEAQLELRLGTLPAWLVNLCNCSP